MPDATDGADLVPGPRQLRTDIKPFVAGRSESFDVSSSSATPKRCSYCLIRVIGGENAVRQAHPPVHQVYTGPLLPIRR